MAVRLGQRKSDEVIPRVTKRRNRTDKCNMSSIRVEALIGLDFTAGVTGSEELCS